MPSEAQELEGRPRGLAGVLAGVFLVTLSVLSLEIALTRVFSVLLRYHHLFLVLSLAVCGLGLGGLLDFLALRPLARRLAPETLLALVAWAAAGSVVAMAWGLLGTSLVAYLASLWIVSAACFVPFFFCGSFLSCAFRTVSAAGGVVYAADLSGAALGSLGVIAALQALGGTNTLLATAFTLCLAPLALAAFSRRFAALATAGVIAILAGVVVLDNLCLGRLDIPTLPTSNADILKRLYQRPDAQTSEEWLWHTEWNAFARTDVVVRPNPYAPEATAVSVYTDGEVPTPMIPFAGDLQQSAAYIGIAPRGEPGSPPACFPGYVPFLYFNADRMLSIGSGAGMDVHLGLFAGSRQIDCVDINPALPRIVGLLREWNGGIYDYRNVRLFIDDGRSFVRRASEPYDMIYMALTQTDTTAVGTLNPVEAYSVTREGFHDYLSHLSRDGTYVFIAHDELFMLRAFLTVLEALQMDSVSRTEALDHVAAFMAAPEADQPYRHVLVVRRTPWSKAQAQRFMEGVLIFRQRPVFFPGVYEPAPLSYLRRADVRAEELVRRLRLRNVLPCTDDRPFFLDFSWGVPPSYARFLAVVAAVSGALLVVVGVGTWRWAQRRPSIPLGRLLALLAYFVVLGLGFMLVEVAIAQKLLRGLGYPALALAVILFALLLGAGTGSALSQRWPVNGVLGRAGGASALVAAALVAAYLGLDRFVDVSVRQPMFLRCVTVMAVVFPLGVAMGAPFPSGVRVAGSVASGLVPWGWALNGVTSVLGSALVVVLGKLWGFSHVLLLGAGVYAVAALLAYVAQYLGGERSARQE